MVAAPRRDRRRRAVCLRPLLQSNYSGFRSPPVFPQYPCRPHPPDPVEQLYRELEAKIREYRPKDDLAALEKAFRFASRLSRRPDARFRRALHGAPAHGRPHPGRHADGPRRHRRPGCCTTSSRTPASPSSRSARSSARKSRAASTASPSSASSISSPPRTARRRASARCCWPWSRTSASSWSSWPTASTTCGRSATSAPSGASASRARPSRSTRPSRIASAWAKSAASWRTWRSSISSRTPTTEILDAIESKRHSNEEFLDEIRQTVEAELRREGIPARIDGRVKRPYSVFQKLRRQKITVDQVYDLMALRIITDSVKNCYAALGVIHNKWRPIPGPHQGLHRDPAAQPVPVAAHLRGRAARADLRSADPHRGDAPHRRRRHRRALEIQGGPQRARPPTISASPGCATWWSGSATCRIPASSCPRSRWTCTRKKSTPSRRAAR